MHEDEDNDGRYPNDSPVEICYPPASSKNRLRHCPGSSTPSRRCRSAFC